MRIDEILIIIEEYIDRRFFEEKDDWIETEKEFMKNSFKETGAYQLMDYLEVNWSEKPLNELFKDYLNKLKFFYLLSKQYCFHCFILVANEIYFYLYTYPEGTYACSKKNSIRDQLFSNW